MQIITRKQWGARYDDGSADAPIPSEWWLHHSAGLLPDLEWIDTDGDGVDDDEQRAMRALEETGELRFRAGISYTWCVPPSGRVYVGHSMHRRGAHTKGRNDKARAICLIGNYSLHRVTDAQLTTVAAIMVREHRAGRARTHRLNGGHRDLQATECPGNYAYPVTPLINRRADRLWSQEDDMQPDERDALYDVREQLTGSRSSKPPLYPGWPTDDGKLTVVDMLRGLIHRQRTIEDKLNQLLKLTTPEGGQS